LSRLAKYGGVLLMFLLSVAILYFLAVAVMPLILKSAIGAVKLLFTLLMKTRQI